MAVKKRSKDHYDHIRLLLTDIKQNQCAIDAYAFAVRCASSNAFTGGGSYKAIENDALRAELYRRLSESKSALINYFFLHASIPTKDLSALGQRAAEDAFVLAYESSYYRATAHSGRSTPGYLAEIRKQLLKNLPEKARKRASRALPGNKNKHIRTDSFCVCGKPAVFYFRIGKNDLRSCRSCFVKYWSGPVNGCLKDFPAEVYRDIVLQIAKDKL